MNPNLYDAVNHDSHSFAGSNIIMIAAEQSGVMLRSLPKDNAS